MLDDVTAGYLYTFHAVVDDGYGAQVYIYGLYSYGRGRRGGYGAQVPRPSVAPSRLSNLSDLSEKGFISEQVAEAPVCVLP